MDQPQSLDNVFQDVQQFFTSPNAVRSLVILILSLLMAYFVSRIITSIIVKAAQLVSVRAEAATDEQFVQLRRVETYLSVTVAIVRVLIVTVFGYVAWRLLSPTSNASVAAIGASAVFVVLASNTIAPLLRDITAGATMIVERWFNVGDYISVVPFGDLGGVVEQVTLRSTKIRSLNGEVIWLHNSSVQGIKMTPHGVRTIAVDVFVKDPKKGRELIEQVIVALPHSTVTIANKLRISQEEKWGEKLWMMSVVGQTPPGREWLIDTYFVESLNELDEDSKTPVLVRKPLVRFADSAAERSFKRAVRAKQ